MIRPASRLALLAGALPRLEVQYLSTLFQVHLHPANLEAQPARCVSRCYLTAIGNHGAYCWRPPCRSARSAARPRESGFTVLGLHPPQHPMLVAVEPRDWFQFPAPELAWRRARLSASRIRAIGRHGWFIQRAGISDQLRPQFRVLAREPRVQDRPDSGVTLHPLRRAFHFSEP